MTKPTLNPETEREFDEKFACVKETDTHYYNPWLPEIKQFIAKVELRAIEAEKERTKNKWFEIGYKKGRLAGMMKERMKHEPDFLAKSLKKVVKALAEKEL